MRSAVCAIFKDEAPYLREWIQFHRLQGFERFHLYNNESTDDWLPEIWDLISAGYVRVVDWPGKAAQLPAYQDFFNENQNVNRALYDWVAFIDIDEFIYSPLGVPVKEILLNYGHNYASIEINWLMFGTNGHKTRPDGLTIENYTLRSEENFHTNKNVKSIINPARVRQFSDPHHFDVVGSKARSKELLRINHYWTRSEEEWEKKWKKGRSDTGEIRDWEESMRDIAGLSSVRDARIYEIWGESLKRML